MRAFPAEDICGKEHKHYFAKPNHLIVSYLSRNSSQRHAWGRSVRTTTSGRESRLSCIVNRAGTVAAAVAPGLLAQVAHHAVRAVAAAAAPGLLAQVAAQAVRTVAAAAAPKCHASALCLP